MKVFLWFVLYLYFLFKYYSLSLVFMKEQAINKTKILYRIVIFTTIYFVIYPAFTALFYLYFFALFITYCDCSFFDCLKPFDCIVLHGAM